MVLEYIAAGAAVLSAGATISAARDQRKAYQQSAAANRKLAEFNARTLREWAAHDADKLAFVAEYNNAALRNVARRNADTVLQTARRNAGTLRRRAGQSGSLLVAAAENEANRLRVQAAARLEDAGHRAAATRRHGRSAVSATLHRAAAEGAITGSALLVAANQAHEVEREAQHIADQGRVAASLADHAARTGVWEASHRAALELQEADADANWLIWQANDEAATGLWLAEEQAKITAWEAEEQGRVLKRKAEQQAYREQFAASSQPPAPSLTPAYLAAGGQVLQGAAAFHRLSPGR